MGTVIALTGAGDKAEATINFGTYGDRRLLLRYAPVEKI
jgi:DNA helicase-2/ATP-dependent DNA helicase PcrA